MKKRIIACLFFISGWAVFLTLSGFALFEQNFVIKGASIKKHFFSQFVNISQLPNPREQCMLQKNSEYQQKSHSASPINSMPPFHQLLLSGSTKGTTFCDPKAGGLRILVILSEPSGRRLRNAIRGTYGNFSSSGNHKSRANWTKIFVVGNPGTESMIFSLIVCYN